METVAAGEVYYREQVKSDYKQYKAKQGNGFSCTAASKYEGRPFITWQVTEDREGKTAYKNAEYGITEEALKKTGLEIKIPEKTVYITPVYAPKTASIETIVLEKPEIGKALPKNITGLTFKNEGSDSAIVYPHPESLKVYWDEIVTTESGAKNRYPVPQETIVKKDADYIAEIIIKPVVNGSQGFSTQDTIKVNAVIPGYEYDSLDGKVHPGEENNKDLLYREYAQIRLDGTVKKGKVRKMEVRTGKAGAGDEWTNKSLAGQGRFYMVKAVRNRDHVLMHIMSEKKAFDVILALPDTSRYVFISITGEHCEIHGITVDTDGDEKIGSNIPRIAEEISYNKGCPTGDVPNIEVDGPRWASTDGVPITKDMTMPTQKEKSRPVISQGFPRVTDILPPAAFRSRTAAVMLQRFFSWIHVWKTSFPLSKDMFSTCCSYHWCFLHYSAF